MHDISNLKSQILNIEGRYNRLSDGICFIKTGEKLFDDALRGGIYGGQVCEIVPKTYLDEISQIEFACSLAGITLQQRQGDFIIISDGYFDNEWGEFYPVGFRRFGVSEDRILIINVKSKNEIQSCSIEIAKTIGIGAFMVLTSRKNAFDFSSARKLQIASNIGGTPVYLISAYGSTPFSPAHLRMSLESMPSNLPNWAQGISNKKITPLGFPAWHVEILKSRIGAIGNFNLEFDYETFHLRSFSVFSNRQIMPNGGHKISA